MQPFVVPISKNRRDLIERVKFEMSRHGYVFSGDTESGTFSGAKVAGKYVMNENSITITVTEKPFYMPLSLIELAAHELFA